MGDKNKGVEVKDMPVKEAPGYNANPKKSKPKKSIAVVCILIVVILALVIGLVIHSNHKDKVISVNVAQVSITANGFVPDNIEVKPGTLVTWTNVDSTQHQVASDPYPKDNDLPTLHSPLLNMRDSYSFTFEKKGTFTYHDQLSPFKLKGTVIVR